MGVSHSVSVLFSCNLMLGLANQVKFSLILVFWAASYFLSSLKSRSIFKDWHTSCSEESSLFRMVLSGLSFIYFIFFNIYGIGYEWYIELRQVQLCCACVFFSRSAHKLGSFPTDGSETALGLGCLA